MFGSFFSIFQPSPSTKRPVPSAKGVYAVMSDVPLVSSDSQKTFDTEATSLCSETKPTIVTALQESCFFDDVWLPSTGEDHHKGVPVVVRTPQHDVYDEEDDHKLLKKILGDAKKLPQTPGKYASNHIMINAERTQRLVPPLRRERVLDQIAREHAQRMADMNKVVHMDGPVELHGKLIREGLSFQRLGVNIARGTSIQDIHKFMMAALAERNNIVDKRFSTMGVGTARTDNGTIYLCQVFGG
jgi:hypothetical protein